jgi:dipeptide transport system substrate-binding protein
MSSVALSVALSTKSTKFKRQFLAIWPSIVLALGLSICAGGALAAKTLVYCSEGSPDAFNPQLSNSGTSFDASAIPMYNRLIEVDPGTTNLQPALAESWDISPDGLRYTFKLRRGVKFHTSAKFKPTRNFNADDVLFSYNRMADPEHPFHATIRGKSFHYYEDKGLKNIVDKVEKIDDYTVVFKLKHPEAAMMVNLSLSFASILSAEYAEKMKQANTPELLDTEAIGTGPFQFVSYKKDATIRYKAFDQYWRGRAKIDNLIYAITPDASVRYAKLKAGECQIMAYPRPADIGLMKTDPSLKLITLEGLNIGYIAFNVEKKPFDNKLVRQALTMAVDKAAILKNIYQGSARAAKTPYPSSLWSYNGKIVDYSFDPVKAKALLAKAGFPNGLSFDLWYLPVQRPYNPDGKRMGELLQADWAKIGVKVTLVSFEWTEYLKRTKNGDHQVAMLGWSAGADPDEFLGPNLSCQAAKGGGNVARWCNPEFEALYQKAKIVPKQAERAKLYEKAQEIIHEEAPWVMLAHALLTTPVRKEVTGYVNDLLSNHYFYKVDLTK